GQRMSNSVITVDGEMCYKFQKVPSNIDREIAINCTGGVMNGSVVRLARSGTAGYEDSYLINMCEFQVFSCSARYWGSDCGQVCGNCRNGTCDKVTGHCDSGCQPRWKSPLCAGCSARYWGSDCGQECGNCRNGTCDKVTGHCDSGCQPGWKSPLCAGCSARYWGSDCGQECGNCRNGTCDKVTGHCDSGCQPGWKSPLCAGCSARYWGSDCGQECGNCRNGTCDKVTGHCDSGCQPGWKSPLCAEIIPGSSTPDPVGAGEGGAAANTGEGPPTAVIVGSAAGGVLAVVLVVSVVIFLIRRRHSQMEPDEVNVVERHGTVSDHNNPVFQNVCDPDNGPVCTPDTPEEAHTRPTAVVKPKQMAAPRPKPRPSQRGHMYENVGVNGEVYPGPSRHSTANMADTETGDDGDALDTSDDTRAAYYNDPVYMTSQAATLGLDRVQQYLLDKLRADTLDDDSRSFEPHTYCESYELRVLLFENSLQNLPYGHKRDHEVGSKEENRPKNRFNNSILPYDATRVVLQGNRDPDSSDYINASYIKGFSNKTYIGAQGPKTTSVCDFWRMVWQEKITHIVMLTNLAEAGKNKCVQYWPRKGKHCKYSSVDVTGLDVEERADCVIRTFDVKRSGGGASRHVTQYHYVTWPDHSVPTASALVEFWRTVTISHRNQQSPSPLLVHCSAGVGRTGTFIALDIAMDAAQNESKIDIFAIIQRMREDRMNMAILEAYTSRHTRLVLHAFNSVFPLAIDPMKTNDRIDSEFKLLNQMKVLLHKPSHTVAEDEENIGKNRTLDILPDDSHLACLSSPVSGRNQYINAVFLSTFFSRLGCIMTQLPLYHTLVDIWRLVDGNDVTTIVSLGAEVEGLEAECCYWPRQEGQSKEFGPFTVTLSSKAILGEHLTSYMLSLQSQNHSYDREVYVLQYSGWTYEVPNSTPDILHLVDLVNARAHILVSSDSATKSGLFRAICDVISRMTFDRDVDVYMAVRHVQIARPESVASLVQYRYLYHVIQEYQKRNAVYNNA
ncbi:hypothetical protein BaRGS_00023647, partial [Batillaria attramentaria]